MGFLDFLTETRATKIDPMNPRDPGLAALFGMGQQTKSGVNVTESTAANFAAYFCGLRAIAEATAGLGLGVFKRSGEDSEPIPGHRAARALRDPNDNMTSVVFRELIPYHAIGFGNFVAEIVSNDFGRIQLWPRHPSRHNFDHDRRGRLVCVILGDGNEPDVTLSSDEMVHIPNPDPVGTGEAGKSTLAYARESLGLGLAADQFGANFFGNGTHTGGVLTLAKPASRERKIEIAEQWKQFANNGGNQLGLAVLDHESTYSRIGIPPEDAQFLDTRIFQVQEIGRWLKISPTKLFDFSRSTFANLEEINKQFLNETVRPWRERIDAELNRKLIGRNEKASVYIQHNLNSVLEADTDSQAAMFAAGRQWGWWSANDVLRMLNRNGIGPEGDTYLSPGNMVPADMVDDIAKQQAAPPPAPQPAPEPAPEPQDDQRVAKLEAELVELRTAQSQLVELLQSVEDRDRERSFMDVARRYMAKERAEVSKAAKRGGNFLQWMDGFYLKHRAKFGGELRGRGYDQAVVDRHCDESRGLLLEAADGDPEKFAERIETVISSWEQRADALCRSVKMDIERRDFQGVGLELRADGDGMPTIVGMAAVFDKLSEDLGGFREIVRPGAFKATLGKADVRALVDHDSSKIIGRNKSGTLKIKEDKRGLPVEITPPDTAVGRDIVSMIQRGDVDGMSFAFRTISDNWHMEDGEEIRELLEVELREVSIVTFPAYPDTSVALRSLKQRKADEEPKKLGRLKAKASMIELELTE